MKIHSSLQKKMYNLLYVVTIGFQKLLFFWLQDQPITITIDPSEAKLLKVSLETEDVSM